jgi:lysozyme
MKAVPVIPTKPPAQRKTLAIALACAIAGPAEGLRQYAYYCPAGILTVCEGHTGADVRKGVKYSLEQCKALLDADMLKAVNAVERCVPGLPAPVLAAFADATFNMGPTIACNTKQSTAARYLAAGHLLDACNQLPRWDRARVAGVMVRLPGLTTRRANEHALCLRGAA